MMSEMDGVEPCPACGALPCDQTKTADHLGRDEKDFAIEFGEYLAKAAERYRDVMNVEDVEDIDRGTSRDALVALNCAVYEFRKRVSRIV